MPRLFLLVIVVLCFLETTAQQTTVDSIYVAGRYRSFRLYEPRILRGDSHPLVINMHGLGSTAFEQEFYSNFGTLADTAGFYMVMPQGLSFNGTSYWDVGFPGAPAVNDVRFIDSLITHLIRRVSIDPARVYATGMSNGGFMSYLLALRLPDRIAAIASVTGGIVPSVLSSAQSGRPIPVMEIHGTADGTVPYAGSSINAPVDSVIAFWVRNNGCSSTPVRTAVPDINPADGCTAENFRYASPSGTADVELYRINGGGHTWPGAPVVIGVTNLDFSASLEIWRFFSKYRVPGLKVPATGGLPAEIRVFPNPVRDRLRLLAPGDGQIDIYNMQGVCVARTVRKELDLGAIACGRYLLRYTTQNGSAITSFVKESN